MSLDKLTNDKQLADTFMGGGILTKSQIKSRIREWGVPYKATNGLYIFDGDEFADAYHRNELQSYRKRKSKKAEKAGK